MISFVRPLLIVISGVVSMKKSRQEVVSGKEIKYWAYRQDGSPCSTLYNEPNVVTMVFALLYTFLRANRQSNLRGT